MNNVGRGEGNSGGLKNMINFPEMLLLCSRLLTVSPAYLIAVIPFEIFYVIGSSCIVVYELLSYH